MYHILSVLVMELSKLEESKFVGGLTDDEDAPK